MSNPRNSSDSSSDPSSHEDQMLNNLWHAIRAIQINELIEASQNLPSFQHSGRHMNSLHSIETTAEEITVLFFVTRMELSSAIAALDEAPASDRARLRAWVAIQNMHHVVVTLQETVLTLQELAIVATAISLRLSTH
ncbi:hypothetical protein GYMLUDRAFT_61895 [Collybiopsis luxurians FD-317 M1]|uniref:Uncharacterized protein n=1 Tax=Collybiopsis luxurians FD-317 M1 TaxID=944289 RepID=A0A0D0CN23_9AGAR|nr:hypothetical protein GYMLUDRAFT_61895 [Collybiopsis luxurians FD-317 M1]